MKMLYRFLLLTFFLLYGMTAHASLRYKELVVDIADSIQEELMLDNPPIIRLSDTTRKQLTPYLEADDCCMLTLQDIVSSSKARFLVASGEISLPFSVHFTESVEVPSFLRRAQKGDIIQKAQLTSLYVPIHGVKEHTILTPDMIEGKQLLRTVDANKPLSQRDFSSPFVIQKQDRVDVTYETPSLSIRTTAIALESKGQGEKIRVKNEKSNVIIQGIVVSSGHVAIPPVVSLDTIKDKNAQNL